MPHLISISLQNSTSISDAGLAALAKLKPLKSLNLKGCRDVSNEGMAALRPLQQLSFLRTQVQRKLHPRSLSLQPCSNVFQAVKLDAYKRLTKQISETFGLKRCPGFELVQE